MLKKSLSLLLLLPSLSAFAGAMGAANACEANGVTIPCPTNAWSVAASALYLQPASILYNPVVEDSFLNFQRFVKSPYDWGFDVEASYYFNTGNDLTINWLNFSSDTSAVYSDITQNDNQLTLSNDVNIVDVEFGQKVLVGADTNMRLFAGAQYASIKNNQLLDSLFNGEHTILENSSKYNGAGPRLGADFSQELPHGFNAFAQGAMAVLVGDAKAKQFTLTQQSVLNHHLQVVPSLDAKIGVGYQVNMNKGALNVMGGWMFQRYFDAILINDNKSNYGYSLNGPYIKAKWTSAV